MTVLEEGAAVSANLLPGGEVNVGARAVTRVRDPGDARGPLPGAGSEARPAAPSSRTNQDIVGVMKELVEEGGATAASVAYAVEAIQRGATGREAFKLIRFT